jgi:hypothetical protein
MDLHPPELLKPWIDLLPSGAQEFLNSGGWLLVGLFLLLLVLFLLVGSVRAFFRMLFGKRGQETIDSDDTFTEDLANAPLPVGPPGDHLLTVYHVPVRMRLAVVAPLNRAIDVDATAIEKLLDKVVPGLREIAQRDRPKIRVWPQQLSHTGFATSFHRRMRKPEPDNFASRWILVAGRAHMGAQPLLVGFALWADEPNMIGRLTLEPHQWLDILRLRRNEG